MAAPIRVLLADDQQIVRAGFRMILADEADIEVVAEAADGKVAFETASRLRPEVAVMDIRMPVMDGIEATRRIVAEADLATRVLVLTTFDADEYVIEALRAGASGFLLKDVTPEAFADAIRTVAAGDALLAPSVTRRILERFRDRLPAPSDGRQDELRALTERELEVFRLLARGRSNREIADDLGLAEPTVKTHVSHALLKLDLRDRAQAVVFAYEVGLVRPGARIVAGRSPPPPDDVDGPEIHAPGEPGHHRPAVKRRPTMTNESAIRMDGLTKHYPGVEALTDLTLDVPAGSIYGFLGPNGAGKSTTLKMLGGLIRPTRGQASVAGTPLSAGLAYRREVGYLAQDPSFYDWMSGRETLAFVASLSGDGPTDRGWIDAVLGRVGLADAAERRTRTYSGGMRQRLGIAQAIVGRPRVLLLDEPVSALDPIGRREVLDLMAELKGETTVFYSTHILDDVQRVSDHVAIIDNGRLVQAAPTEELLRSFTRDRLQVALGGASDATAVELATIPGALSVEPSGRRDEIRTYLIRIDPEDAQRVQHAVTRFAADRELTLVENGLVRLDLEDVFLRLIDPKERAA